MTGSTRATLRSTVLLVALGLATIGIVRLTATYAGQIGLGDFPFIAEFAAIFAFLTLAEWAIARVRRR